MRRGQGTLEYLFFIAMAAAVLIVMAVYMKRGYQGQVRGLGDQIASQYSPSTAVINNREVKRTISTVVSRSDFTTVYNESGDVTSTTSRTDEESVDAITKDTFEVMGRYADEEWD